MFKYETGIQNAYLIQIKVLVISTMFVHNGAKFEFYASRPAPVTPLWVLTIVLQSSSSCTRYNVQGAGRQREALGIKLLQSLFKLLALITENVDTWRASAIASQLSPDMTTYGFEQDATLASLALVGRFVLTAYAAGVVNANPVEPQLAFTAWKSWENSSSNLKAEFS